MLSCFSCVRLCVTPWTVALQAPLSMGFSRQEYQSELSCAPPGDLPDPGMEPVSLVIPALAGGFFYRCTTWKAPVNSILIIFKLQFLDQYCGVSCSLKLIQNIFWMFIKSQSRLAIFLPKLTPTGFNFKSRIFFSFLFFFYLLDRFGSVL